MSQCTRRRFLSITGTVGLGLGAGAVSAASLSELLEKAKPMVEKAQPLAESLMLNEAQEVQIGENYYEKYVEQSGGRYPDAGAQQALKRFAQPLVATSERDALHWDIVLVENDQVNAWALPGGKIAVHSALVSYAAHPAELGSVIAHEIGHAELSHGVAQMRTQAFLQTVSAAGRQALAAYSGTGQALSAKALDALEKPVFQLVNAGYSRKREYEADAHILSVFDKTGMEPGRADDFFRTLNKLYPPDTSITTSLFSTHPGTTARIERIEAMAATRKTSTAAQAPPGWRDLKERFPTRQI